MAVHSVKHKRRVIGCFSLILFIIFGSAFGVSVLKVIKAKKEKPEVYEEKIPVFNVFSTNITVIKTFTTVIKPDKSIELSAAVNEEIKNIYVEIGSVVTQDQVLIELDERYKKIDVRKAMSKVLESTVALSNAEIDLSNNRDLYKAKVVGDDILRANIVAHRNAIANNENTKAILDFTKERLMDCIIRAPCNGKISKRYVDTGERVAPGQPLLDMIDDTKLRVIIFVGDRDISSITYGKSIIFNIGETDDTTFTSTVAYISSDVEPKSLLYRVEALYDNKDSIIKPCLGKAIIPMREYKDIIVIPSYTVKNDIDGSYVTLLVGTSNVNTRIETGKEYRQWLEIKSGLKSGDKVILR
jgi:membrane fusion protein (multidrug efflux system)